MKTAYKWVFAWKIERYSFYEDVDDVNFNFAKVGWILTTTAESTTNTYKAKESFKHWPKMSVTSFDFHYDVLNTFNQHQQRYDVVVHSLRFWKTWIICQNWYQLFLDSAIGSENSANCISDKVLTVFTFLLPCSTIEVNGWQYEECDYLHIILNLLISKLPLNVFEKMTQAIL